MKIVKQKLVIVILATLMACILIVFFIKNTWFKSNSSKPSVSNNDSREILNNDNQAIPNWRIITDTPKEIIKSTTENNYSDEEKIEKIMWITKPNYNINIDWYSKRKITKKEVNNKKVVDEFVLPDCDGEYLISVTEDGKLYSIFSYSSTDEKGKEITDYSSIIELKVDKKIKKIGTINTGYFTAWVVEAEDNIKYLIEKVNEEFKITKTYDEILKSDILIMKELTLNKEESDSLYVNLDGTVYFVNYKMMKASMLKPEYIIYTATHNITRKEYTDEKYYLISNNYLYILDNKTTNIEPYSKIKKLDFINKSNDNDNVIDFGLNYGYQVNISLENGEIIKLENKR